jgi:hypothetical protein
MRIYFVLERTIDRIPDCVSSNNISLYFIYSVYANVLRDTPQFQYSLEQDTIFVEVLSVELRL